jgi:predicted DCC family thiol-disulfide oxidoreductase YuxK
MLKFSPIASCPERTVDRDGLRVIRPIDLASSPQSAPILLYHFLETRHSLRRSIHLACVRLEPRADVIREDSSAVASASSSICGASVRDAIVHRVPERRRYLWPCIHGLTTFGNACLLRIAVNRVAYLINAVVVPNVGFTSNWFHAIFGPKKTFWVWDAQLIQARLVMTPVTLKEENAIILYDGLCNLCNASVRFVLAHDRHDLFRFVSLQSEAGKNLAAKYNLTTDLSTFFLVESGKTYEKSDAWLETMRLISWPWSALHYFRIVPRSVRDWAYDVVGRNRYHWFGRQDSCPAPKPESRWKFLS